jgi:peptidoglycan/xylan/chitin deacetylase (PgdA/CDA1 family)
LRELAARARDKGHRIGNHTLTHAVILGRRPGRDVAELEIGQAQSLLEGLNTDKLFRPNGDLGRLGPHMLSQDAVDYLQENGFTAVSWNCVPQDWVPPAGAWVQRAESIMAQQNWTLIVLHDHCLAGSMQHLEAFLDRLIAQGCEFMLDFPPECVLIDRGRPTPALESAFQAPPQAR